MSMLMMVVVNLYSYSYYYSLFIISMGMIGFHVMFSFSSMTSYLGLGLQLDEVSLFMGVVTFAVIAYSMVIADMNSKLFYFVFVFSLVFSVLMFMCDSLFLLYFFFEASLVPIILMILVWGSYSDRSLGAFVLSAYTVLFSLPFMGAIFFILHSTGSLSVYFLEYCLSDSVMLVFVTLSVFLVFAVKLPMYGVHFWLPIAHVEAPTCGSMVLAGVLLKLGGVGMIRCLPLLEVGILKSVWLAYALVGMTLSCIVCCFQSDFKRLIAYSSVFHMMPIIILLMSSNPLSCKVMLMIMCFHGFSSPMLFALVGGVYSLFGSRQLLMLRGMVSITPVLCFMCVCGFFMNISAPPFPSFVSEVYFFISTLFMDYWLMYSFLAVAFLGLLYNLNWFTMVVSVWQPMMVLNSEVTFRYFKVLAMLLFNSVVMLSMISMF